MRGAFIVVPSARWTLVAVLLLPNSASQGAVALVQPDLAGTALDMQDDPFGREALLVTGNIARTYAAAGDIDHALIYQRRADAILEKQISLYVASGSERQKLAFVQNEAVRTGRTLSLHLNQAPGNSQAAALAALVLLQRKGRVQDAMTDLFAGVRERIGDSRDRLLMDQLQETTVALSRIALGLPSGDGDVRQSVARIESRREQLEAALSEHNTQFRAEIRPVTVEAVQAAIPAGAALLEFAVFRPFDPRAERNEEAYGRPRYAVYIILKQGTPIGIDLGPVDDIDPLVLTLRRSLRDPAEAEVRTRARAVDERLMRPVRPFIRGATRLLISPDGGLNLLPFEALADEYGRYLIEQYSTTYLTSGRDLLRMQMAPASTERPVIVADPLFGEPAAPAAGRMPNAVNSAR